MLVPYLLNTCMVQPGYLLMLLMTQLSFIPSLLGVNVLGTITASGLTVTPVAGVGSTVILKVTGAQLTTPVIKLPMVLGCTPTLMVAIMVYVAVLITETLFE